MATTITTFGIFQQILTDAVAAYTSLGTVAKASMTRSR